MARAALLLNLVKTGIQGDLETFKKTVNAIADEERSKHHHGVADELGRLLDEYHPKSKVTPITQASAYRSGINEVLPERSLDEVILDEGVLDTCQDIITEHAQADILRQNNLQPRHKILLYGPPGNGKTSLAEALAEALMVPFIKINYDELISKYLGDTAKS
ncbi:MAG: ATP-binding protein, partial [Psychrosphaera sp.]|nr:ATP-binding protein [Psychrosphaera sp.]